MFSSYRNLLGALMLVLDVIQNISTDRADGLQIFSSFFPSYPN
jgi:hypothetical protein